MKDGNQVRAAIWEMSRLLEDVDAEDREIYAHGGPVEMESHCRQVIARRFAECFAQEEGLSYEQ